MKLIHRGKSSRAKKGSSAPWQSKEKTVVAVDGGGAGSNCRQVAPVDVPPSGTTGYGSSKDEVFFEASTWLDSDCEDDFYSVNGDATPARRSSATGGRQSIPFGPQKLPTLEAILKAEPLKPPPQMKLGDFLKVKQESVHGAFPGELFRAGSTSSHAGGNGSPCCIPQLSRAISSKERRKRQ